MTAANELLIVLCTVPEQANAERLAEGLVEERLAACVNAIPGLKSFYRWQGKVETDSEIQLLIKTRRGRFDELAAWLKSSVRRAGDCGRGGRARERRLSRLGGGPDQLDSGAALVASTGTGTEVAADAANEGARLPPSAAYASPMLRTFGATSNTPRRFALARMRSASR